MSTDVVPVQILLVEDNRGDARLTQEALREGKVRNVLHHVRDGEEALRFLLREGEHAGAPRPDIVLLDLNMPRMGGQEVLGTMKGNDSLRTIPVVVLTTSDADADVARSYELQASCYITKPVSFEKFTRVVQQIESFWFTVVRLP